MQATTTAMRELDANEIEQISGGNYIVTIGLSTFTGALIGGISYSYDTAISGATFDWTAFTADTLQGAVTGFLVGAGGIAYTLPGGVVAGVTAESTAAVITVTDPADSLQ
jgi:hypothetical protein